MFEVGGHYDNVMRLVPPLITTRGIIDSAITIMEEAIAVSMNEHTESNLI